MTKKTPKIAPDFDLRLSDGIKTHFYDVVGNKPVILFFYPSSSTYSKTCQQQSKAWRDALEELNEKFSSVGGSPFAIIGVSSGGIDNIEAFKAKFAPNFPLGAITTKTQHAYGARASFLGIELPGAWGAERVTFLIDPQKQIVKRYDLPKIANGPAMTRHAKEVVADALQLFSPSVPASSVKETENSTVWQERVATPSLPEKDQVVNM